MKKSNIILLVLFIILAVFLNFIPRVNYSYPLHVDEWVHFQYANNLSNGATLYFGDSYKNNLEEGFHFLLAELNSIGVPYLFMFRFFPSILTVLICLGAFVLTRRLFNERAGVFSVLFIALLKSSVMILGPVFLVPMAIGMFFIAIGLFLIKINSRLWILILASILIIHPPSAMAFLLLINIEFIILKKGFLKNVFLEIIAGIIALPLYINIFLTKGIYSVNSLNFYIISNPLLIPNYIGWALTLIVLAGIYFSAIKKNYSIIIQVFSLLFFILIFYYYKTEVFIPYARALMYLFLLFSAVFGLGCDSVISFSKDKRIQKILIIILIIVVLFFSINSKIESNNYLYHIIEEKDYDAFLFVKENTNKNSTGVLDPFMANAFTPIAERKVYSRVLQGKSEVYELKNVEIKNFFNNECKNIDFLKEKNISIVYGECNNSELRKVYEGVYLLE